jgi:hypothetical protein
MQMDRIIALQDKNWRLNGDFIVAPDSDPGRFYPVMQEGDLAIIGFDGAEWPAATTVVLLSQSADIGLWSDLTARVSKGLLSMVRLDESDLQALATRHVLPAGHVIRQLAGRSAILPATTALPVPAAPTNVPVPIPPISAVPAPASKKPTSTPMTTPGQLAARLAAASLTGQLGERMVDAYLRLQQTADVPVHTWVSEKFAEHPYDFELLAESGSVQSVIDAKATSQAWTSEFFMSSAELAFAAASSVPYHIYRVSGVDASGGELRISDNINAFATAVMKSLGSNSPVGTRYTGVAIHPVNAGISWSKIIHLPSLVPAL